MSRIDPTAFQRVKEAVDISEVAGTLALSLTGGAGVAVRFMGRKPRRFTCTNSGITVLDVMPTGTLWIL